MESSGTQAGSGFRLTTVAVTLGLSLAACTPSREGAAPSSAPGASTATPAATRSSTPGPTSQRAYLIQQQSTSDQPLTAAPVIDTAGVGPKTLRIPAAPHGVSTAQSVAMKQGVWVALSCSYGPHFAVSFEKGGGYSTGCQQPGNMASAHVPARQVGRTVTVKIPAGVRWWLTVIPGLG